MPIARNGSRKLSSAGKRQPAGTRTKAKKIKTKAGLSKSTKKKNTTRKKNIATKKTTAKKSLKKQTKGEKVSKPKEIAASATKPSKIFRVLRKANEIKKFVREMRTKNKRIALVPTMGSLHSGHLALIKEARQAAQVVVVSVFVNPTQFGPNEDLDRYPRDLSGDRRKIRAEGVDIMYAPDVNEMYPEGFQTFVEVTDITRDFCGAQRPSHFRGVTTVVAKLFHIVQPDVAIFGEKDFQQLVTIRRMSRDLNMDINIVGRPTVREEDGLAMSSRNTYLSAGQRQQATAIFRGLSKAKRLCESGEYDTAELAAVVLDLLREQRDMEIDYVSVCDPESLERIHEVEKEAVVLVAVRLGDIRLIDNIRLRVRRSRGRH
jgi:pantoate--beta-alanine ligase